MHSISCKILYAQTNHSIVSDRPVTRVYDNQAPLPPPPPRKGLKSNRQQVVQQMRQRDQILLTNPL